MQKYVVDWAANTDDLGPYSYVVAPNPDDPDPVQRAAFDLCAQQRIRNTGGFQTFSFLGVMIVVCVGAYIIIMSWVLEFAVSWARKKRRTENDCREIARIADQKFQLQRKALSGSSSMDPWTKLMDAVPVTERGVMFRVPLRKGSDYSYPGADIQEPQPIDGLASDSRSPDSQLNSNGVEPQFSGAVKPQPNTQHVYDQQEPIQRFQSLHRPSQTPHSPSQQEEERNDPTPEARIADIEEERADHAG